ncbi:TPM domain-containing protein [Streptococcaceae bacterium ESL0687]|nr:TPM domain-containing protein [Streptococcaceae bacterium ESL0687]
MKDLSKKQKKSLDQALDINYARDRYDYYLDKIKGVKKASLITVVILSVISFTSLVYLLFILPPQATKINDSIKVLEQEKKALLDNPPYESQAAGMGDYTLSAKDEHTLEIDKGETIKIDDNNIFVSDNASIIDQSTREEIYNLNKNLAQFTDGAQYMVVTIDSLPKNESIESYATKIFRKVGIGKKGLDNGVLYLISVSDRKFRLEVGYGMEGVLNDAKAGRIINDDSVVDDFKDKNYSQAIKKVSEKVVAIMNIKVNDYNEGIDKLKTDLLVKRIVPSGLLFLSLSLLIAIFFYLNYLKKVDGELSNLYDDYQRTSDPGKTDFYYLLVAGPLVLLTLNEIYKNITFGKFKEKNPDTALLASGILVGDKLYNGSGAVITNNYSKSSYNPSNKSSGGDSFGGGSSGGGGASGGW